jgi:hypothetical protein
LRTLEIITKAVLSPNKESEGFYCRSIYIYIYLYKRLSHVEVCSSPSHVQFEVTRRILKEMQIAGLGGSCLSF